MEGQKKEKKKGREIKTEKGVKMVKLDKMQIFWTKLLLLISKTMQERNKTRTKTSIRYAKENDKEKRERRKERERKIEVEI